MQSNVNLKIGGEFQINPELLINLRSDEAYAKSLMFANGRSALMYIISQLTKDNKKRVIHIPYYICKSVYLVLSKTNLEIRFYDLNENFVFQKNYAVQIASNDILLLVNYFGFTNNSETIKYIKKHDNSIVVIEDCVQAFFEQEKSIADYTFTSYRKFFATPDGASVSTPELNISISSKEFPTNEFYLHKLLGGVLKHAEIENETYLEFFKKGEEIIDSEANITLISLVGKYLVEQEDYCAVMQQRKNNTKILYELGKKAKINFVFDYNPFAIPLCVPILLNNRDRIRKELFKNGIYLPVHWGIEAYNECSEFCSFNSKHIISLIIDQRYSQIEIEREMNIIVDLIEKHDGDIL